MIDATKDDLLTICEAAALCPKMNGKRPSKGTIWRWMRKGLGDVYLEHVKVGGRVATTREALDEFFRKAATTTVVRKRKPMPTTVSSRDRAMAAADATLARCGVHV